MVFFSNQRLMQHYGNLNFGFRIHYNKLFKPEYLPARVRYNQFFFYSILVLGLYQFKANVSDSHLYLQCINSNI